MPKEKTPAPPVFADREHSWLAFNRRVLSLAQDEETPLGERLRFLSIFSSNLDEFCMIRVGSLLDRTLSRKEGSEEGTLLRARLRGLYLDMQALYPERDDAYARCRDALRGRGVTQVRIEDLSKEEKKRLRDGFDREIRPLLSPQIVDARHPFPHLENQKLCLAVRFKESGRFGLLPVPDRLPRVLFPDGGEPLRWILLEDVLLYWAGRVFGRTGLEERVLLRVTRNADLDGADVLEEDGEEGYPKKVARLLRKRTRLAPVRLEAGCSAPKATEFVRLRLGLCAEAVMPGDSPLDYGFLGGLEARLPAAMKTAWSYAPHRPVWPAGLSPDRPVWEQVARRDRLLRLPYDAFAPLPRLLREAAEDPSVTGVKITLYRVGDDSDMVTQLCRCAENGKETVVFVELGARFDEARNLGWASRLEEAGCRVLFGQEGCKVHAKVMLIVRKTERGAEQLCHFGTGNYNEKTARQYTDYGLLTTRTGLCRDAARFFDRLALGTPGGSFEKLITAPDRLRSFLYASIEGEIKAVSEGRPGRVLAKLNSLTDRGLCQKLLEASQAGVAVRLVVRGACCLLPGLPGLTDNVEIVSILGRFLEHSRLFAFGTGAQTRLWLSSADWMSRNLDRRAELAVPVLDGALVRALLLELEGCFTARRWRLRSDGTYELCGPDGGGG